MISKDWRRRFKVLSERLETYPASIECEFALEKFEEAHAGPINLKEVDTEYSDQRSYEDQNQDLVDRFVDKELDLVILAAALFRK